MYPFVRLGLEMLLARRAEPLPPDGIHVSHHTCLPWDLDPWRELNNGRTLTLYDLGRMALAVRTSVIPVLRAHRWGMTVAGASVRYRRRVGAFQRVEVRSQLVGRDDRFFYAHQAMYRGGEAVSAALLRSAVIGREGLVPTDAAVAAFGWTDWDRQLPAWVTAWIAAEATRPWPPEIEA